MAENNSKTNRFPTSPSAQNEFKKEKEPRQMEDGKQSETGVKDRTDKNENNKSSLDGPKKKTNTEKERQAENQKESERSKRNRFPTSPSSRDKSKKQKEEKKPEPELGHGTIFLMISTALFYDLIILIIGLLHFIPVIGNLTASVFSFFVSLLAFLTFFIWFTIYKVKLITPKRLLTMAGSFVSTLIPFISFLLPSWTLATIFTIISTKSKIIKKVTKATSAIKPQTS